MALAAAAGVLVLGVLFGMLLAVGLALLLGLMLFATWNDLQQMRVFKILGGVFS